MHAAVRRLAGPSARNEVEDLVQEVFVVAQRRWPTYEGRGEVSTWLYGICIKVVAGHRRGAWARALLGGRMVAGGADELPHSDDPHRSLDRTDSERLVYRVLDGMSEKRRMVLILFELEERSGEEIARILGIPVTTVWTRLFHARREFREKAARELGLAEGE